MSLVFKVIIGVTWMYEYLWPILKLSLIALFGVASVMAFILVFMKMWSQLVG